MSWPRAHRPWPMPACPWAVALTLENLLFLHWPARAERLRLALPAGLEVDTHDDQAWLSLVLYRVRRVRTRLARSLSAVSAHGQMCVRTYVTHAGRPRLFFLDLGVDCPSLVRAARVVMGVDMHHARVGIDPAPSGDWRYRIARAQAEGKQPAEAVDVSCRPRGELHRPEAGTLGHFLLERFCSFSADSAGAVRRCDFHHQPWHIQPAEARVHRLDTIPGLSAATDGSAPIATFTPAMDLAAWLPKRVYQDDPVESRR